MFSESPQFSHAGLGHPVSVPVQSRGLQWTKLGTDPFLPCFRAQATVQKEALGPQTCWIQKGDRVNIFKSYDLENIWNCFH